MGGGIEAYVVKKIAIDSLFLKVSLGSEKLKCEGRVPALHSQKGSFSLAVRA